MPAIPSVDPLTTGSGTPAAAALGRIGTIAPSSASADLGMMSTMEQAAKDGFRIVEAGRDAAERLVAAVGRFHAESGHEVGPEQAAAIDAL